jgi:hypothetical protein
VDQIAIVGVPKDMLVIDSYFYIKVADSASLPLVNITDVGFLSDTHQMSLLAWSSTALVGRLLVNGVSIPFGLAAFDACSWQGVLAASSTQEFQGNATIGDSHSTSNASAHDSSLRCNCFKDFAGSNCSIPQSMLECCCCCFSPRACVLHHGDLSSCKTFSSLDLFGRFRP